MPTREARGRGIGTLALGVLLGLMLAVAVVAFYFRFGKPPVAVADGQLPFEGRLLRHPVNQRIDLQLTGPPFGSSEEVFVAGARTYMTHCASCHGTPGRDSAIAAHMDPRPTQLWRKGGPDNVLGVSETETGRTYWKIANGIRLTGMPAYSSLLSETEMWQVSLLLKHAGEPMPKTTTDILSR